MSEEERNRAENLILMCADHHDEIDRGGALATMTVPRLRELKRDREEWIARVTGLERNRSTAVLRMLGNVRGNSVELSRATASAAVLTCDERFPDFSLAVDRHGIEIDLRGLPGELTAGPDYWRTATAKIDEVITHQVAEAIASNLISHISVFAFARLPLLVYLGSRLDDNIGAEIYQRHRAAGNWEWPDDTSLAFGHERVGDLRQSVEALLVLNVSGTVAVGALPSELRDLPQMVVSPSGVVPAPDLLASRQGRDAFEAAIRFMFADLERDGKNVRRLHVIGALPVAAAIVLGRAHDPHLRPAMAVYSRDDFEGSYSLALEIS